MDGQKKYLLIVNPEAGSRSTMQALPDIDRFLRKKGVQFEFHFTDEPGHATDLVREMGDKFDVIVSVGGDGTINEIINGMPDLNKPLGIIPIGTGNDFARSCCIPYSAINEALEILLRHDVKKVDVGQANGHRFINVMGLGFEGKANAVGQKLDYIKGVPKYIIAIGVTFVTYRRLPIKIELDTVTLTDDFFLLSIGNGWNVGGGIQLTPNARVDDGLFDICYVKDISRWRILSNFNKLYDGSIYDVKEIVSYQSKKVVIESNQPLPIHLDGEKYPHKTGRIEVGILPGSQQIIGNWKADKRLPR